MNIKNTIFIVLVTTLISACSGDKAVQNKLENTEVIAVKVFPLASSEGEVILSSTGILSTENEARYAFKIGGVIDQIFVKEGDYFTKGKLLAKLKVDEIDAGLAQAKLGVEKAERDLKRVTNLYKDSVATLEQLQNTTTAFDLAVKQFDAIRFNRDYALIYATSPGFVTKKIANEGEIIGEGMPVLAINENVNDAWVLKVGLSDRDWAMVDVGNAASVVLDAYPDKKISGQVFRKSLAADMGSGSFQVEIRLDSKGLSPALGMFGKAKIETNKTRTFQSIPYQSLVEADGNKAFVFVPLPEGKVMKQPIVIADFDNDFVNVKSGLENIKEVIVSNSAFLNSNSTITIIQ